MHFTERTELEQGFSQVFDREIREKLLALENTRLEQLGNTRKWIAIALGAMLAVWGLFFVLGTFGPFAFFLCSLAAMAGIGGSIAIWSMMSDGWASSLEEIVMPPICAHVGDLTYDKSAIDPFPLDKMRDMGLLPGHSSVDRSNRLDGIHRGTAFEMIQVDLKTRSRTKNGGSRTTVVFSGLLFHITVPVRAPGPIKILQDRGALGNKLGEAFSFGGARSYPKVSFDNKKYEAAFETYALDPDGARDYMPDLFLDNLVAIGRNEGGRRGTRGMVAGFDEHSFYLALKRKGGFLNIGKLTRPVAEMEEDLHGIFADIEMVHRIIDRLHNA